MLINEKLDYLAKRYYALEKSDISQFQRKARLLQSIWREEKGYKPGLFRGRKTGNYLTMPLAKQTLSNYLTDNIKKVVRQELYSSKETKKLYGKPRIYNNLLSSQPLCFNLFAELKLDLDLATKVFRELFPMQIAKVTTIEFEYSPGRRDIKYTGDRSAFDVYAEFLNSSGGKGFVGIEVKYHENLQNKPAEIKERHLEIASEMNCFRKTALDRLHQKPLEQIWRDHLLAGSILHSQEDGFDSGLFVFLYPRDNFHCSDAVLEYEKCLSNSGTFRACTLEDIASVIKRNTDKIWIDEVIYRYLDFGKITKHQGTITD
ncbi:MAG: hypothetical protein JW806_05645 [Sedimentisphaerales bacterium]|nr:hypothetical protein [Sedimentisphaerales bacterium]